MCEAGGDVPDPVVERIRVGFPQVLVIVAAEEAGQAARSAAMFTAMTQPQLTCHDLDGRARSPMALAVRTPPVSTTACSRWTTSIRGPNPLGGYVNAADTIWRSTRAVQSAGGPSNW